LPRHTSRHILVRASVRALRSAFIARGRTWVGDGSAIAHTLYVA